MFRMIFKCFLTYFLLLISSSTFAAVDSNIRIRGKVTAVPCTVLTENVSVELGDLYTFDLVLPGAYSVWKETQLKIVNCPNNATKVTATFKGTSDGANYYKNLGTSNNLQLELQSDDGVSLHNGATKVVGVNNSTKDAIFPLRVRAITVNGNASQGTISSIIEVTYKYE